MKKISRRSFCVAALAGAAALAFSACSGGAAADSSASTADSAPAGGFLLRADEYPRVDGSTACIPLMAAMMHETTGVALNEAQTSITVSTTGYAWQNMTTYYSPDYSPELLIVYEAPAYIQQEIADSGVELEITPIGRDALVFMVNEQNPVQSLTHQQLIDIYTGKLTNWKDVGGADSEIIAFQRSEDSGSQTLFQKLVMGETEPMAAPTELAPTAMGELVDMLAAYNNAGNALGFSVYYYIDQMYSQPGLRLMAVEGVAPSNESIGSKQYPFCNDFYAVIRADTPADSPARKLYDWICSDAGRACLEDAGYVPAD